MKKDLKQDVFDEEKQQTAGANVYDDLHKEIIELTLKPGAMISIKDLCEHFGTSRSPVRDALIRLAQEGLITTMPQRGTMISKIDLSRIEQERFLRVCVEERVMDEFIKNHQPHDIEMLEKFLALQKVAVEESDYRRFIDMDDEFHSVFYTATGKTFCVNAIQNVSGHYRRFRLLTTIDKTITVDLLEQHSQILEAVKENNIEKMHQVLNKHFMKIHDEEIVFCKKFPSLFTQGDVWEQEHKIWDEDFMTTLNNERGGIL